MKYIISSLVLLLATSSFAQTTAPTESNKATATETAQPSEALPTNSSPVIEKEYTTDKQWARSLWGVYGIVGFPKGLGGGFEYLDQSRLWSVGLNLGVFHYERNDTSGNIEQKQEANTSNFAIEGKYHPWASSFFLGADLGVQHITAKETGTYSGQEVTPQVKVNTPFITPKFGWFWQFQYGLNFGVELGAQIPLSNKVDIDDGTTDPTILNNPDYIQARSDAEDAADKIGKTVLPHVLLRLGYAF